MPADTMEIEQRPSYHDRSNGRSDIASDVDHPCLTRFKQLLLTTIFRQREPFSTGETCPPQAAERKRRVGSDLAIFGYDKPGQVRGEQLVAVAGPLVDLRLAQFEDSPLSSVSRNFLCGDGHVGLRVHDHVDLTTSGVDHLLFGNRFQFDFLIAASFLER